MKFPTWLRALILSPPVLLLAAATRLLLMSNNDPAVAMKIAQAGGVTGTLLGTIIPLLPAFLPAFVAFLLISRRWTLAAAAALSMLLVSLSHTPLDEGVRNLRTIWHLNCKTAANLGEADAMPRSLS
ncbi:hypothetical protein [Saccharopolyspora hattusasensis]|uniref:hypothetical protein n=1 Tax=Saccharopolyspora hattusasensis TaxID=1128679 RepID=UPI003D97C50E